MGKRKCKADKVGVEKCKCKGCSAMMELMNAPVNFSFSVNCCSGIVPEGCCECWRCRKARGQEATEETEALAKKVSEEATAKFHANTQRFLEKMRKEKVPQDKWADRFVDG